MPEPFVVLNFPYLKQYLTCILLLNFQALRMLVRCLFDGDWWLRLDPNCNAPFLIARAIWCLFIPLSEAMHRLCTVAQVSSSYYACVLPGFCTSQETLFLKLAGSRWCILFLVVFNFTSPKIGD
jgi:hypothetical protein